MTLLDARLAAHPAEDAGPDKPRHHNEIASPHASHDARRSPNPHRLPLALFGLILGLIAADLVADWLAGVRDLHLGLEVLALIMSLAGVAALWRQFIATWHENRGLELSLGASRADTARWRSETQTLLDGLGSAIDLQFRRWSLTPAEEDVGLLLLKGMSLKEIAALRATSERTVRQQALTIYRKAGLAGRAELAAFFLEDLLLPSPEAQLASRRS